MTACWIILVATVYIIYFYEFIFVFKSSKLSHNQTYTSFEFFQKHEQQLPHLIPFVHDVNTYQALASVLTHIQLLWELILLNEPIAILANSPTHCSQTVQALGKLYS